MKTMTCKQLGGACDEEFTAKTFNEIVQMSKQHGAEMFQAKDEAHLKAMSEMGELMNSEGAFEKWFNKKRAGFDNL
jgi:hypothetical protein